MVVPTNRMERWFPTGFKHELKELYAFAWPLVLATLFNHLMGVTSTMFSGQLGPIELDAVSMGVSMANLVGASVGIGLITACDTLFAQSYGSTNKEQVGVYLQTAFYICSLSCVLSWALLINTNYILLVCGQNPAVAKEILGHNFVFKAIAKKFNGQCIVILWLFSCLYVFLCLKNAADDIRREGIGFYSLLDSDRATEEFMFFYMPALFFLFLFRLLQKYLQVQGIIMPVLVIGIIANIINIGLQYVMLHIFKWGVKGSAIGLSISNVALAVMTIGYVLLTGSHKQTWGGWSRRAFDDWGEFMKLGLASIAMICLEWWTYEVSAFLTGILGDVELGASSITYQIWMLYSALPLGIGSAVAFKIGRYLGEKRPEAALTVSRVTCLSVVVLAIGSGLLIFAFHKQLPYMFSKDHEIITLARELLLLLAIFMTLGCFKTIFAGIIRGTGRQVAGGVVSFVAYVILAMPIGIPLMFLTSLGAAGFWWGLIIGLTFASVSMFGIVWRTDWHTETDKAQIRARLEVDETCGLLGHRPTFTSGTAEITRQVDHRGCCRNVIIQKTLIATACFGILAFGFICRFLIFIPPKVPEHYINTTSIYSITNVTIFN